MSFQKFLILFFTLVVSSCASKPAQQETPAPSEAASPSSATKYAWVELGSDSIPVVRVIRTTGSCPDVMVDGTPKPMQARIEMDDPGFPIEVCEARIETAAQSVSIEGKNLKLPIANPKKIVVIGDTGCRIKVAAPTPQVQACNDPAKWPFLDVVKTAAAEKPDLVIHVGDYYYRESPCPENSPGCKGSPSGDHWASWDADFFAPADPLLKAAPWVFVRGNHELCSRGGQGWFKILDPHPYNNACVDVTPAYLIKLGKTELAVLDSANADVTPEKLTELKLLPMENAWVLTHRPVFDPFSKYSSKNSLSDAVNLTLAGHIHVFQALTSDGKHTPQVIAGNAGTALDNPSEVPTDKHRITLGGFGYLTLVRNKSGDKWKVIEHNAKGKAVLTCTLTEKKLKCPKH
jgi:predicted phosphodiesterase